MLKYQHISKKGKFMEINENIVKQITETAYLTKENTKRYRPILRFFFEQNENMKYFMYKEDIYNEFIGKYGFENYTIEMVEQDLSSLVEWNNLVSVQDTEKANTVEEFKSKKYRYQLSDYTIEIERLILKLENLHIDGSSLEPTLIERIKEQINKIDSISKKGTQDVYGWWEGLNEDFKRLNEKYKNYIRSFYNIKMEEIAGSTQFIIRKNELVNYLKQFIKILQDNSYVIENKLMNLSKEVENLILNKVIEEQRKVVRVDKLNEEFPEELIRKRNKEKWNNLKSWFIADEYGPSEVANINEKTSEIIRKITRIASQIAETKGNSSSRKVEYKHICEIFAKTKNIEEAHKLASVVFGISSVRHIKGDFSRNTDSINSSILEEESIEFKIKPRVRTYREKNPRTIIKDKTKEKKQQIEEYLKRQEQDKKEFEQYIVDGKIELENLPVIKPKIRKVILKLIGRANQSLSKETKTDDGRKVVLIHPKENKRCELKCDDGVLKMPAYILKIG